MLKPLFTAFLTGALLSVSTTSIQAQVAATEGPGGRSCGDLVDAQANKPDNYREFAVWVSGFLTAANAYEEDTFDLTPWQPIEVSIAQIAKFCEANPQASVSQAMGAYINFLKPGRLTEQETLTQLRNDKNAVFIYPSVLAQLREKLIEAGFLTEAAPQEFGPDMGQALQRFQRSKGINASGLPDARTLIALLG